MVGTAPIVTVRLQLVALTTGHLQAMHDGRSAFDGLRWPPGWPSGDDVGHVSAWRARGGPGGGADPWGPRAIVLGDDDVDGYGDGGDDEDGAQHGRMIGHAGFHRPPQPIALALADPTFDGSVDPAAGGAVELGYTVFDQWRGHGFAREAARALVGWAFASDDVGVVVASVAVDNAPSIAVLAAVGDFRPIGTCRDDDGTVETVYRRDRLAD